MACLALSASGVDPRRWAKGLAWLANIQRGDGSVPATADENSPGWPTSLAVLAWRSERATQDTSYQRHIEPAVAWLLQTRGLRLAPESATMLGHDTTLQGWPWVQDTHSWVEPTSYALLALRATGNACHPRAREGVKLLLNRALPSGGWNYGNTRVFGNALRPFPVTTGIALAALAGEPDASSIKASRAYLTEALSGVRSPLTVGWGLIGLTAWDSRPPQAEDWLARCAARTMAGQPNHLQDALLLLAGAGEVFPTQANVRSPHGSV